MLDAGFTTLTNLKQRILPIGGSDITDWDDSLCALGLAVAAKIQGHLSRILWRGTKVDEFNAAQTTVILRAYPVETITSIQIRTFTGDLITHDSGYQLDKSAGLLQFASPPGDNTERIVVTYTGGYFLNDSSALPEGATPLPDDIIECHIAQVQLWAEARNLFGTVSLAGLEAKTPAVRPSPFRLADDIADALSPHRRYANE